MRSKALGLVLGLYFLSAASFAGQPGDKRTILTSGEKVHTIHYQLGQSTVVFLGVKPETVICGNKNYFNVEKLKDAITIQPLSNFSTNLTVFSEGRRYLFYLTPAGGRMPDGFIDVKWVPKSESRPLEKVISTDATRIQEIGQKIQINKEIDLVVLRQKTMTDVGRTILEMEMKSTSSQLIKTSELGVMALNGNLVFKNQMTVWETDQIENKKSLRGRIILTGTAPKSLGIIVKFRGKNVKTTLKGVSH